MKLFTLILIILTTVAAAMAQTPPNNCAAPYWRHSLRCEAFPSAAPQANFGSVPLTPPEVKEFTRVFIANNIDVRCADGTLPVIYVDKAVGGASNNWIFTMTGGGSVAPVDTNGDGIADDAQLVVDTYADPTEMDEMGTAHEPPMKSLFGINNADPAVNAVFAGYNRVRIEKCSYDRYLGRKAWQAPGGFFTETGPAGGTVKFNLYQQGALIVREVLDALTPGLTYTTWEVDPYGQVVAVNETLPPLLGADKVLFVGHSGAAHGLMHDIDNLADYLASKGGFAGDVRALFDANFLPSIQNEAWFDSVTPHVRDAYDTVRAGQTVGVFNTFTYDPVPYWATSLTTQQYKMWDAVLDRSCQAAHSPSVACYDRHHVLLNHISTPFFIREDFIDNNIEHLHNWGPPTGPAHEVHWGDAGVFAHCPPPASCLPRLDPTEYHDRLAKQIQTMIAHSLTRSEMATGADSSLAAIGAKFPTFYAFMPRCGLHAGAYNNDGFFRTPISYIASANTMDLWLQNFLSAGRTDLHDFLVNDWTDPAGNTMTTMCPP